MASSKLSYFLSRFSYQSFYQDHRELHIHDVLVSRISDLSVVICRGVTRKDSRVAALITDGADTSLTNAGSMEGVSACKYCQVLEMGVRRGDWKMIATMMLMMIRTMISALQCNNSGN